MGSVWATPPEGAGGALEPQGLLHDLGAEGGVADKILFLEPRVLLLLQGDDLFHDLRVVAHALGFAVDILDVVGDGLLFFFESFDTLDKCAKLVAGDAMSIRHRGLLIVWISMNGRQLPKSRGEVKPNRQI